MNIEFSLCLGLEILNLYLVQNRQLIGGFHPEAAEKFLGGSE